MKIVKLECLLMENNEIHFNGRSLGVFTKEEIDKYAEADLESEGIEMVTIPVEEHKRLLEIEWMYNDLKR